MLRQPKEKEVNADKEALAAFREGEKLVQKAVFLFRLLCSSENKK